MHVLVVVRQRQYRPADFPERRTEILSAMRGDQDQTFTRIKVKGEWDFTFCDAQQCIDHRIASNKYVALANTFFKQVLAGALGRGEMPLGQLAGDDPVHFFRKRIRHVPGAKPGFHVPKRNLVVEAGERHGHDGSGVALRQHDIRLLGLKHIIQSQQETSGQSGESLVGPHDIQIDIRLDLEDRQNLIEKVSMLCRRKNPAFKSRVFL